MVVSFTGHVPAQDGSGGGVCLCVLTQGKKDRTSRNFMGFMLSFRAES